MQTKESIMNYEEISENEVQAAFHQAIGQVRKNLPLFYDQFPGAASKDEMYEQTGNDDWTNGFWTGELWLSYEMTKEVVFKEAAEHQAESFLNRIIKRIVVDHHDMGFLYSPSCVAAWKLTGNKTGKKAALLAADNLMGRFQEKGQFFQAWGSLGAKDNYRLIIDCLLNMPLLFWASEVTGDNTYKEKAEAHIKTAMKYVVRPDYSTYHTYYFDPETGDPVKGVTQQGYRDGSIWARGQAWGIYGTALSYGRMKDPSYLKLFEHITDCFIENLPSDLVPYWDFDFTDGSGEPRDSSASAIAACGMLEMAKYLDKEKAGYYTGVAKKLLKALYTHCAVASSYPSNGVLLHATYAKQSPYNGVSDGGVDECNIWGDYFYMEALMRLTKDWNMYW